MHPKRIVICTLGTRGDFAPFAEISRILVEYGHEVDFLTNDNWIVQALKTGAKAIPIAPADASQSGRNDYEFFRVNTLAAFRRAFDHVAQLVRDDERPLLICRSNMTGAHCAAERFGLERLTVYLQPSAVYPDIRRLSAPAVFARTRAGGACVGALRASVRGLGLATSAYARDIRRFRRSVGLSPAKPLELPPSVLLCPRWFAMPGRGWPVNCEIAGFPRLSGRSAPDPELEAFLGTDHSVVVVTPGTGVTNVEAFFANAVMAARAVGRRSLLLSRHSAVSRDNDVLTRPFAPLSDVLPRSCALIHHGGIGTTAEGILAGVPQMVIPDRFDQPDNAVRIARLGLGGAVFKRDASSGIWADTLKRILDEDHIALQVGTAARLARAQDGADFVARRVAALLGRDAALSPQAIADIAA